MHIGGVVSILCYEVHPSTHRIIDVMLVKYDMIKPTSQNNGIFEGPFSAFSTIHTPLSQVQC